ncbi:MAG: hypothetical protein DRN12_03400 [Thermoplasmata archaeon]|nr:MAG: hypothetical protein DRN12_03400 [Thermoplasmata archaeon]
MSSLRLISLFCFISGIIAIAYGVSLGEVKVGIFFIIPFLIGSGFYAFIGFLLLFIAFLLFFLGGLKEIEEIERIEDIPISLEEPQVYEKPKKKRFFEGGGVVLIGPIPIIFGTNIRITLAAIIMAIIFILIVLSFLYLVNL